MRRLLVAGVCAVILVVAQSAGAATVTVQISDFKFAPRVQPITIGDLVSWHNNSTSIVHGVTTNDSVPGSFITMVAPLTTSGPTDFFGKRVGTYAYHCQFHPRQMKGVINTAIGVDATTKPLFNDFTLTWSTVPGSDGHSKFDIQVRFPHSDKFVTLVRNTADTGMTFVPHKRGVYLFRGRFQDFLGHTATGLSRSTKITVT